MSWDARCVWEVWSAWSWNLVVFAVFVVWMEFEREVGCALWVGDMQVQPELMAADSVRMEIDGGGGDDSAMPLLDNFDSLESKVLQG